MNIFVNQYPENWSVEVFPAALKKADWKCQVCKVPRGARIIREEGIQWLEVDSVIEKWAKKHNSPIVKVKLFAVPLNGLKWDVRMSNLKVLCDKCKGDHVNDYYSRLSKVYTGSDFENLIYELAKSTDAFLFQFGITTLNANMQSILTLESIYDRRHQKGYSSQYDKDIQSEIKRRRHNMDRLLIYMNRIAKEFLDIPDFSEKWKENISRLNRQIGVQDEL